MTNNTSKTTADTAPAPDKNRRDNREGGILPQPINMGASTPPAPEISPPELVRKIDGTIYEVTLHFSATSEETIIDKFRRLIRLEFSAL